MILLLQLDLRTRTCRRWLAGGLLSLAVLAGCGPADSGAAPGTAAPRMTPTPDVLVQVLATPQPSGMPAPSPTPLAELGTGQHISARGSYTDTETLAAGPMYCRIARDTPPFRHLVSFSGPGVLFSGSEPPPGSDEDRLMHPSAVGPLARLAELASAEWGEAEALMVTEAYDSNMDHDIAQARDDLKYSLHFEGRSLDVVPWPPNGARLARLCALAHAAGFDWVHNEEDHCHVSVEAPTLCPTP
jgi:hypothetical protein